MTRILFVCLGNICRSPAAEGVMKDLLDKQKKKNFFIDSAGILARHEGENADPRMIEHAKKRGIDLTSLSRPILASDLEDFDFIIAMDKSNLAEIHSMASERHMKKIFLMSHFFSSFDEEEVPDPYFGGADGFELTLDMVREGSLGLVRYICEKNKGQRGL